MYAFHIHNKTQWGDRGSTAVKVLCYKFVGRWFNPSWCHWIFLWHTKADWKVSRLIFFIQNQMTLQALQFFYSESDDPTGPTILLFRIRWPYRPHNSFIQNQMTLQALQFFYSESDDPTGPTILLFRIRWPYRPHNIFFFKVAPFTLNTFFTAFYERFKHTKWTVLRHPF